MEIKDGAVFAAQSETDVQRNSPGNPRGIPKNSVHFPSLANY